MRLLVGRIVRPHGTNGEVLVEVLSEVPERFAPGSALGAGDPDGEIRPVTVVSSRPYTAPRASGRAHVIVALEGVVSREHAQALRGAALSIPTEHAAPPPAGGYYPHQIEGAAVVDEAGNALGVLARVEWGVANDLWVVDAGGREVRVPAVEEFIVAVDPDAGRIVIRPIPGLFDEA